LVRFGRHDYAASDECNIFIEFTLTPGCFDPTKLPQLSIHQIAFWDEVHNEQVVGVTGDVKFAFPRNENGAFHVDGEVAEQATKLHMKYSDQGRF
jgi:hypothetical protein